jgi:triosephosphate isomerase
MRQILIAGNWKMNGTRESVELLVSGLAKGMSEFTSAPTLPEMALFPPTLFIPHVAERLAKSPIRWGGQDLSEHAQGAYTGETSAIMLKCFDSTYVLVGHSERRQMFGDTDARTVAKVRIALEQGLIPVLCVGETKEERESEEAEAVVARQLHAVLDAFDSETLTPLVVAYEPVWAIGTGLTATPEEAQSMHQYIRETVAKNDAKLSDGLRILYGGSANAANATDLLSQPDIDGLLVGGASLDAESFISIYQQAVSVLSAVCEK